MANLPQCPTFLEGKGCERSELVLAGESSRFWTFICRCCHLEWVVSKPVSKQEAQYVNEVKRMQRATDADRAASQRPRVFTAPRGGWTA